MAKPGSRRTDSIPIDSIEVGDQLLRHDPNDDAIIELGADLTRHGLLQPIGVAKLDSNRFQLLWGGRRLAAAIRIGWQHIPATIYDAAGEPTKALALVENIHRAQLTLAEEIAAVQHLHDIEQKSPDQIAVMLSKGRAWVMKRLAFDSYPADVADAALNDLISLGAADVLATLNNDSVRAYVLNEALQKRMTVPQLKFAIDQLRSAAADPEIVEHAVQAGLTSQPPPQIFLECQACHQRRLLPELTLVRICANGCETIPADTKEH